MPYAVLFPGQGSQHVGMGEDVFAAQPDLVATADEILGWSLRDLCARGPEEQLTRTEKAQPALYAVGYALWSAFREVAPPPVAAAGHSLGEYTALAAAGAVEFGAGLGLVAARGLAMASVADESESGMAALLGGDAATAETMAAARRDEGGMLWVANLNAPGQVVLAGGNEDIAWAAANGREFGVRRVIPLKVAGAFHSPLMQSAADALSIALEKTRFAQPEFPVWSNTDAKPIVEPVEALRRQLVSPVRFAESLESMAASGVETFIHIGPGDVTAGLVKRTVPNATVHVVSTLDVVPAVASAVQ